MHDHQSSGGSGSPPRDRPRTVSRFVFWGFVAVAAYFLITEHRAHLLPFLPFLLIAACPLLHLFHHSGHAHGGDEEPRRDDRSQPPSSQPPSGTGGSAHQH